MKFFSLSILCAPLVIAQEADPIYDTEIWSNFWEYNHAFEGISNYKSILNITKEMLVKRIEGYETTHYVYREISDPSYRTSLEEYFAKIQPTMIRDEARIASYNIMIEKYKCLQKESNGVMREVDMLIKSYQGSIQGLFDSKLSAIKKNNF